MMLGRGITCHGSTARAQDSRGDRGRRRSPLATQRHRGRQSARQSGKLILVYIRNDNCRFCDLLQKNTWQDPRTRTLVERKTVPLKLTWEENREAVEAMQVTSYPSTLLFTRSAVPGPYRWLCHPSSNFQQRFARVQADLSELAPSARPRWIHGFRADNFLTKGPNHAPWPNIC